MNITKKSIAVAVGGAFVLSVGTAAFAAAENPFAIKSLSSGYQIAEAEKAKDGKCGTGKCGANKKKVAAEAKAKEGSCSADKAKEGSCHADKAADSAAVGTTEKAKEGSCSADKAKEGSCHADKK